MHCTAKAAKTEDKMSYLNEYTTLVNDTNDDIAKGKDIPRQSLEFYKMYFLAAIADELHAMNITSKDIRNELKKRK